MARKNRGLVQLEELLYGPYRTEDSPDVYDGEETTYEEEVAYVTPHYGNDAYVNEYGDGEYGDGTYSDDAFAEETYDGEPYGNEAYDGEPYGNEAYDGELYGNETYDGEPYEYGADGRESYEDGTYDGESYGDGTYSGESYEYGTYEEEAEVRGDGSYDSIEYGNDSYRPDDLYEDDVYAQEDPGDGYFYEDGYEEDPYRTGYESYGGEDFRQEYPKDVYSGQQEGNWKEETVETYKFLKKGDMDEPKAPSRNRGLKIAAALLFLGGAGTAAVYGYRHYKADQGRVVSEHKTTAEAERQEFETGKSEMRSASGEAGEDGAAASGSRLRSVADILENNSHGAPASEKEQDPGSAASTGNTEKDGSEVEASEEKKSAPKTKGAAGFGSMPSCFSDYGAASALAVTNIGGGKGLYESPAADSPIAVLLPPGALVAVEDSPEGGTEGFRRVSYMGTEGWVPEDGLVSVARDVLSGNQQGTAYAVGYTVLYKEPSRQSEMIMGLGYGNEAVIEEARDGWLRLACGGNQGWIEFQYVNLYLPGFFYANGEDGTGTVDIHQEAKADSAVTGTLPAMEIHEIREFQTGFGKLADRDGWVDLRRMVPCTHDFDPNHPYTGASAAANPAPTAAAVPTATPAVKATPVPTLTPVPASSSGSSQSASAGTTNAGAYTPSYDENSYYEEEDYAEQDYDEDYGGSDYSGETGGDDGGNAQTPDTGQEEPAGNTEDPGTDTPQPGGNTEDPGTDTPQPGGNEEPEYGGELNWEVEDGGSVEEGGEPDLSWGEMEAGE